MSFDIVHWLAALAPILALLVLLLYCHWGGDEAALVVLLFSILIAYFVFGGGLDMIALAVAKGIWTSLSIILVVFPALIIYEVSRESGAFSVIRAGMQQFTPDKVLQVLAVGWIFDGFLQGITGFGVPVVVCAPLLIGMGVKPLTAVLITLLGQAWGNTFGTLGLAWDGLVSQVDVSDPLIFYKTIIWTTSMLGVVNLIAGLLIASLAGGYQGIKRNAVTVILLGLFQGIGQIGIALLNPMLCNFIIASVSLGLIFMIGRLKYYRQPVELYDPLVEQTEQENTGANAMNIHQAFIPYVFLIVLAVVVLLNSSIKNYLGQWQFSLSFAGKSTALGFTTHSYPAYAPLAPLINSGAFLLLAALIGYLCYVRWGYIQTNGLKRIMKNSLAKTIPSAIAVIGLIAMSKVMDDMGQTTVLAQGVAAATGGFYPILSPLIGLLGTFMTSSNLSSNILFGSFQQQVAQMLQIDKAPLLAAQTVGGAVGSIISPSKILLGTTAVGMLGHEGEVISKVIGGALLLCAAFGAVIFLSYQLGW
ncbi:lactate permease [Sporomusaceae bacterium BoRhaA]|uniref:L-lactate permease n=1 Tax=Pelorhabdus rhamnosifermentans TaxID=2772457 RepID=UPI001C063E01|nr:L-lactate permease [Pelorhabdus rhamnosifermentans]MBU2702481.1 lactate permease [Pelorhabdus rhamnosifermentans]